ncbi:MAG: flagellar hook protein FlgE [Spirochaetota bacterium]|nr:flagellar hook protein FlgE [Spirochaetota bacterium]
MMRSLYAGVSGLQNHQLRTDVIGNNISNINTNGFKKGRVNFQDMISQTMQGASRPTDEKGGTNSKQVGLGMTVASIDTLMYQGSLQTTGKMTDLAIQGEGFFIQRKGDKIFYTRAGNYSVDREKNLVNPSNGFKLQGWNSVQDSEGNFSIDNSKTYEDVKVPIGDKFEAKATKEVVFKSNIDSRVDAVKNPGAPTELEKRKGQVHFSSINVYDSQGKVHKLEITFVKTGINQWQAKANVTDTVDGSVRFDVGQQGNVTQDSGDNKDAIVLTFNEKGAISTVREAGENNPDTVSNGELSATVAFNVDDGTIQRGGPRDGKPLGREQRVKIMFGTAENFDGVTQMASNSTTKAISQNGYGMGYLDSFNIDQSGVVTGVYTNGQVREIAQVSMATFINPGGLEKAGETTYMISNNSGIANVSAPDTQGKGKIIAGALEMSNVDLAEEFTNMIVTQRGFQANSRIITTSDHMLQELLSLKR